MQPRLAGQQLGELLVEAADRVGGVEAEGLARGRRAVAEAVPDFHVGILLAAEQQGLRMVPRHQDDGRFRLAEAGEVVEIAVVAVGIVRIAVAHALGRGGDHRDAAAHAAEKARAPVGEGLDVHGQHR